VKLALRLVIAGAGLALFAWFVHRTGVDTIPRAFATLGWSAPLILLPYALVYLLDTVGWRLCFGRTLPKSISFGTLFRIRWAGESLNNVVPSAYLGGEAAKVYLLHKRGLPVVDGASSVIIGKTAQVLAEVIFIAFGAVAGSSILPANSSARAGMFAIAGAATALMAMLFWLQHRGMFSTFLALTRRLRLRIRALTSRAESLRQLDRRILGFYRNDRRRFLSSVAFYLAGWIADSLDILLVSYLLECRWIGVRHWPLRHSSASPRHSGFLPRPPLECRKVALFFSFTFSVCHRRLRLPTPSSAVRVT
jgi:uncharacterized protein (TIRG00374 family)